MKRVTRSLTWIFAVSLACLAGCKDGSGPAPSSPPRLSGLFVSSPIPSSAGAGAALVGQLAYVSLPPGSVKGGISAAIRDGRSSHPLTLEMVDGGFDPVGIPANVGDTIFVDVTVAGTGAMVSGFVVVSATRLPHIVRTSPPNGARDVPLNAEIVVVFSQPVDPATVDTSSVELFLAGVKVSGSVRLSDPNDLIAEFDAAQPLAGLSSYQIRVSAAIRDVNGLALDSAPVVAAFETSTQTSAFLVGGTVSGLAGSGLVLVLNGAEALPVSGNGAITFATTLASGAVYSVRVLAEPSNPAQLCVVDGGEGRTVVRNITTVAVTCSGADPTVTGKIVFQSSSDSVAGIYVLDLDRSTITQVRHGPGLGGPQWSPQHDLITFVREANGTDSLWVMNPDGTAASSAFYSGPAGGGGLTYTRTSDGSSFVLRPPDLSPDGTTIAYDYWDPSCDWSEPFGSVCPQVWLENADGSNPRPLPSNSLSWQSYGPAWSPDGTKLAFIADQGNLEVAPLNGSAGARLIAGAGWDVPDWSPDGRWLVFTVGDQLFIAGSAGGGGYRQLTSMPGGADGPAWSR